MTPTSGRDERDRLERLQAAARQCEGELAALDEQLRQARLESESKEHPTEAVRALLGMKVDENDALRVEIDRLNREGSAWGGLCSAAGVAVILFTIGPGHLVVLFLGGLLVTGLSICVAGVLA